MTEMIIKKVRLDGFFEALKGKDVYGPVTEDGITRYQLMNGTPDLKFKSSRKPPKEIFFPQTEKMFDLVKDGRRFVGAKDVPPSDKDLVLFGIRPCDGRAFNVLDKLFNWDYKDPYYLDKREKATVIGLGCTLPGMPKDNCFCTSMGGSPGSSEGMDMLWVDIGDSYYVESLNDKGDAIFELGKGIFEEANDVNRAAAGKAIADASEAIDRKLDTTGVREALAKVFDDNYWAEFAKRCLGCGICTFLCPTCHCFDIQDIVKKGEGVRQRTWDSCQFDYYSIHASKHNPRPEKKNRQRNRVYHKFYYSENKLGLVGCVGCGRCINLCPVNIDIIEVVEGAKVINKEASQ